MDWKKRLEAEKTNLLTDLQNLIQIESVLDETKTSLEEPFGLGPKKALEWMLEKGRMDGFTDKNIANMAGHLEIGEGEELLGILGHVDVVPATGNWKYGAFSGEIANGKMYGRGAIDDKGPTIAAYYAMKIVKDAGIPFTKRVRLIIGSDEESGFRCVKRYFETEEMPTIAFAPDADFPIINSEKGISTLKMTTAPTDEQVLTHFQAGKRTNMVPDFAQAELNLDLTNAKEEFSQFQKVHGVTGELRWEHQQTTITLTGVSAHAMEPEDGKNAAILLAKFLSTYIQSPFIAMLSTYFYSDSRGKRLQLNFSDEASGETTFNPGVVSFTKSSGGSVEISMRYSVSYPFESKLSAFQADMKQNGVLVTVISNDPPHFVPAEDPFIQTLQKVYERQTGEKAALLSIGGGTYARVLEKGVAFGMLFPGEKDVAHQIDEFVDLENLYKAVVIYADAIAELATKN
ncbi:dipeptidase PepV [Paenisporosarcina cavernae]|uniref:Dipeptidase PepV n=1 Tax=Paenisporosarcina cavernae TaxID=2320858 RepID=A0A385YW21_9BACL|nr:dipeptidase PepV [Paenisporosarcina cavernae]AYC29888.1 dipeptidase PepV [Paenisporosarcina cavernae]